MKNTPWLTALIIGERNGASQKDWQILRNTGTNHLMAIAGLHIGMIAGVVHIVFSWCWRRFTVLALLMPAHLAGMGASLLTAILYSALAGFSIPTQRACIMLTIFITTLMIRIHVNRWYVWGLSLLIVLIMNPLSVLADSFWLSFGTIGLIIYGMNGRLAPNGIWWKWGRVQWVIGVGLIPLTLLLFHECSLVSFIANTLAIPWLGFIVLPFCFLSGIFLLIFPAIGHLFLFIADQGLSILWASLVWFSHLPYATWEQTIPGYPTMSSIPPQLPAVVV